METPELNQIRAGADLNLLRMGVCPLSEQFSGLLMWKAFPSKYKYGYGMPLHKK